MPFETVDALCPLKKKQIFVNANRPPGQNSSGIKITALIRKIVQRRNSFGH